MGEGGRAGPLDSHTDRERERIKLIREVVHIHITATIQLFRAVIKS